MYYHWFIVMSLYEGSVQYVFALFASVCYYLITRLMFYYILFMSVSLFCMFVFHFCLFCAFYSFLLFCLLFFHFCLSLSYFCTSLPNTTTGWKPNCNKYIIQYHIIPNITSHYIITHHITYDMIYDMTWCDAMWYDMIWYNIIYDIYDMVWYDMVWWYDMIWYDWCDMILYDTWYDMIYDTIWYNIIYMIYGMVWYDDTIYMIWYRWYNIISYHIYTVPYPCFSFLISTFISPSNSRFSFRISQRWSSRNA